MKNPKKMPKKEPIPSSSKEAPWVGQDDRQLDRLLDTLSTIPNVKNKLIILDVGLDDDIYTDADLKNNEINEEDKEMADEKEETSSKEVPKEEAKYLTIGDVSKIIGRTPRTIKNWYKRYEQQPIEEQKKAPLPEMFTDLDAKKTRLFLESQIHMFEVFRENKSYGKMEEPQWVGQDDSEKQIPLIERWANDPSPIGFTSDRPAKPRKKK